ncbi:efflux RND transporter periplasmic adaptor subunit [Methylocaldum sp. 14B]|uniref:efflux RND transporter periplasmic adaptor subunit n=1 Tax=Methylocaldum sp. 14B TaxID=1912213 RepID=UPI001F0ADD9A|nr:efflux RND transporter periplasmic adaptor subunit [Methylocaldum sp. 14B]
MTKRQDWRFRRLWAVGLITSLLFVGCGNEQPSPPEAPAPATQPPADHGGHEAAPEQKETAPPMAVPSGTDMVTISPQRLQEIGVKFEEATRRPLDKVIRTVGLVVIDERRQARVNIKFSGWIDQLLVSATGDHVKKGQILFTIYSPDLVATQREYLLALQAKKELGGSSYPEVAQGAVELLEDVKRRFQLWDITEDHIRDLERTGQVLRTLPIHSPITGTVIKREALAGAYVEPGTELYIIADLSHIWILGDIYEYELPSIRLGQEAKVTLSYDPATVLTARVTFIYPTLDPKTRTAKVRFELDNPGEKLKPEMYANVEVRIPLGNRLVVPQGAVLATGTRNILFVDRGQGRLEPRDVQIGVTAEGYYEIQKGLAPGERVVASAAFLIDSESQLRSALGMMGMPGMEMDKKSPAPTPSAPEQKPEQGKPGMNMPGM